EPSVARRRRKKSEPTTPDSAQPPMAARARVSDRDNPAPTAPVDVGTRANRIILYVILAVFVLFEVAVIGLFISGESIHWKKELSEIDETFERGKYTEAARDQTAFGEKWPGAKETLGWNEKMGLYYSAAGNHEVAATHFQRAVE